MEALEPLQLLGLTCNPVPNNMNHFYYVIVPHGALYVVEDRQCCYIQLWDRKPSRLPWSSLHEESWRGHESYGQAGTTTHVYTLFFSSVLLQWVIDSGATSDWNIGSLPDDRGLACLSNHGVETSHSARQVHTYTVAPLTTLVYFCISVTLVR